MTSKVAIEQLRYIREVACADCSYWGDFEREQCKSCSYHESFTAAIEALEKQIPKKPDFSVFGNRFCSSRGKIVRYYTKDVKHNYCCYYGQAVDWSDSND